ncbi:MAG: nucleotidyltransferase domain-containing protein [Terriglobales bacterium]
MGARRDAIATALFGATRSAVLSLLFQDREAPLYSRQITRELGLGQGAVQRELRRLSAAGILRRIVRARHVYYLPAPDSPVLAELRGLLRKTTGVAAVLREFLAPLKAKVQFAFIYGSYAEGALRPGSDVDLFIVGKVSFVDVVSHLVPAQATLGREINPSVYSPAEFASKLAKGHHFVRAVVEGSKIVLIGDERELAAVGKKRLAT